MGQEQSTLEEHGYKTEAKTERCVVATKDNEKFLIRSCQVSKDKELISLIETLRETSHPHIVSTKNSFKHYGEYFIVMDYCPGGSLAEKIRLDTHKKEDDALCWTVEVCMALEFLHERKLLHKDVTPTSIYFTTTGKLRLGGFGKESVSTRSGVINYLAPEVFTEGTYDFRSEIWSLGCILHETFSNTQAFSAESNINLIPKINQGDYAPLPKNCSKEFRQLLRDMLNKNPDERPTASEILREPIMIRCLSRKCKRLVEHLQSQLMKLSEAANNLERVHQNTTIGSLAGGVIGAAGGVTSIVGLILAPFTLGASLIVTGVGIGVGVAGGVTAGASNITKMVNETSDRKAVQSIIQDFDEEIKAVALWLQVICESLEQLETTCDVDDVASNDDSSPNQKLAGVATRVGRGLGGVAELCRLARVVSIGKIAAQASRAVRVAETATGVLSGLFLAADVFFIFMDAREIHRIRSGNIDGETRSEIMKFVNSIRKAAGELQDVLDEFKNAMADLPSLEDDRMLETLEKK